jgi:hypothetical protein
MPDACSERSAISRKALMAGSCQDLMTTRPALPSGGAQVVLARPKSNPVFLHLYVVGTTSGALAQVIARKALGPEFIIERGHPVSSEVAKGLNLKPGEVRKF